jgi:nucleotidyltransferase/DNA polymerase involved in DNA repair
MPHYYLAHLDADCFFCQVHHLATDLPPETPLVVQQQNDIISVNYPARALGVTKHQLPLEIKQKYPRVHIVQAFWTGTKVSYQPYRAASSTIFTLVKDKAREHATVPIHFERTSIDEGYLIFQFPNLVTSSFESQEEEEDNDGGNGICSTPTAAPTSFSAALQDQDDYVIECQRVVQLIRNDVLAQYGFHLSAGIGPTKLLAKLASKNAKPKGQTSLTLKEYHEECDHLLVDSLSNYTRAVDQQLQQRGCSHDGTLKSIRQYGEQQLMQAFGDTGDTVGRRLHDQLWGGQKAEKNEVLTRDTTSHFTLEHDKWFKSSLSSRVSLTSSVVESILNKTLSSHESHKSHKIPANNWYSRQVIMQNAQDVYPFLK